MKKIEVGVAYCIPFSKDEIADLDEFLQENGYEQNADGIKKFLLDEIYEPDQSSEFLDAIKSNPEIVQLAKNFGKRKLGEFLKKKFHL